MQRRSYKHKECCDWFSGLLLHHLLKVMIKSCESRVISRAKALIRNNLLPRVSPLAPTLGKKRDPGNGVGFEKLFTVLSVSKTSEKFTNTLT